MSARGLASRFVLYAFIWGILTAGDIASWGVGLAVVAAAALGGEWLGSPLPLGWRLGALLRFIPFFLWQSLLGAIVVARLAFRGRLNIEPVVIEYRTRLPDSASRVALASIASLLPGTLVLGIERECLQVHAIDANIDVHAEFARLERRLGAVLGWEESADA